MAGTNSFLPFDFDLSKLGGLGSIFGGSGGSGAPLTVPFGTQAGNLLGGGGASSGLFGDLFSRQSMFGGTNTETGITTGGWAPVALGAGQAIFGALQGNKANALAEKQFKEGVRQFDLNFNAQRKTINSQLEDRQRARNASNSTAYQSTDEYLKKNAV